MARLPGRLAPWPRKFCITTRRYGNNAVQLAALVPRTRSIRSWSPSSYRAALGLIAPPRPTVSCNCLLASVCAAERRAISVDISFIIAIPHLRSLLDSSNKILLITTAHPDNQRGKSSAVSWVISHEMMNEIASLIVVSRGVSLCVLKSTLVSEVTFARSFKCPASWTLRGENVMALFTYQFVSFSLCFAVMQE